MSDLSEDNEGEVGDGDQSGCVQESQLTDLDVQAFLENDVSDMGKGKSSEFGSDRAGLFRVSQNTWCKN